MDDFLSELEASAQKHVHAEYQNPSVDMKSKYQYVIAILSDESVEYRH